MTTPTTAILPPPIPAPFTAADEAALAAAVRDLEGRSFAMTVATKFGMPLEALMHILPTRTQHAIGGAVESALDRCLRVALHLGHAPSTPDSRHLHTAATAITGAAGGFFGLAGLAVELPVTTTVMLHSIAQIARNQGEDLSTPDSALACLQVLALGPEGVHGEVVESAYYASRAALAQVTRDAAAFVAKKGLTKEGAPVLVTFLSRVAARFGLEVTDKVAAQLVPVVGAAGGLALNILFTTYFQRLALGHFTIRRLERTYGADAVRRRYNQLRPTIK